MSRTTHSTPRGIIFDLDGTLIDTLGDIATCLNIALAEFGHAVVTMEQARAMIGEGLTTLLQRASGEADAARLKELVNRYRAEYRARMFERTRVYDGVSAMLDELQRSGAPMCVLSNKSDEFTVPLVAHYFRGVPFVAVRGATDEASRKPDPTHALAMGQSMRRASCDVLFVGDSSTDIHTARNAGMIAVAVTWGFRDREHLLEQSPDHVVDSTVEIARLALHAPRI